MKEFLAEVRARADEGYSTRQLMASLIPDIGKELKVANSEVTAAMKKFEVANYLCLFFFSWLVCGIC